MSKISAPLMDRIDIQVDVPAVPYKDLAGGRVAESFETIRHRVVAARNICAPEKRPCTPKDTILTPGFGYSITPVPKFPDRPGKENRVHFSYALTCNRCRPRLH